MQGYLLLSSSFLKKYMTYALDDHTGIKIGGRTITNLRFAGDIDGLAGGEQELAKLVERLDTTSAAYGMEIRAEEIKLMTNNAHGINTDIRVCGEKREMVSSFKCKYLGSVVSDKGFRLKLSLELLKQQLR